MTIEDTIEARGQDYGTFAGLALLSQRIKEAMRQHPNWENLPPDAQEALEMIVHKVCRTINGNPHKVDTWHDIAGYATLVEKRIQRELP